MAVIGKLSPVSIQQAAGAGEASVRAAMGVAGAAAARKGICETPFGR